MANPTLLASDFQKHVPLRGLYRTNTLAELNARIFGISGKLRGFAFVSENVGVDVTLTPGDFISIGNVLDVSLPTREAGIIVRTLSNVVIDISGFTDPAIYGLATNTDEGTAVQFLVTEALPPPTTEYAPLIFKSGGSWYTSPCIGPDSLAANGVLASGTGTVPAGSGAVTINHNLGLTPPYKVFLQATNQSNLVTGPTGFTAGPEAGILYPENLAANSFDVQSSGGLATDFNWMVIA